MNKLFTLLLLSLSAWGQDKPKTAVYIDCTCEDQVGLLYATALRDAVASSPRFKEVSSSEVKDKDGKTSYYNLVLSIITIDTEKTNPGNSAAISVVLKIGNSGYLSQWIQICGRQRVAFCAADTLADFDRYTH